MRRRRRRRRTTTTTRRRRRRRPRPRSPPTSTSTGASLGRTSRTARSPSTLPPRRRVYPADIARSSSSTSASPPDKSMRRALPWTAVGLRATRTSPGWRCGPTLPEHQMMPRRRQRRRRRRPPAILLPRIIPLITFNGSVTARDAGYAGGFSVWSSSCSSSSG